jgi:hypothetical protein
MSAPPDPEMRRAASAKAAQNSQSNPNAEALAQALRRINEGLFACEVEADICPTCGNIIEDFEELIALRTVDLVTQWELDDPRDRWKHTGELPPPRVEEPPKVKPYRTPQATIDAFFGWVIRQDEAAQARWLAEHPKDAPYIRKLLEEKCRLQPK